MKNKDKVQMSTGRLWSFRLIALVLPLIALAIFEFGLRLVWEPAQWGDNTDNSAVIITMDHWKEEISMPKPDSVVRIFVLGGSVAEGFGVDFPFSTLMEEKLSRRLPTKKWEVVNGGIGGVGSDIIVEILNIACTYEPDMVCIYLGNNEFLGSVFYDSTGLVMRLTRLSEFARKFRIVQLVGQYVTLPTPDMSNVRQRHFFGISEFPLIHSQKHRMDKQENLEQNLKDMAAIVSEHESSIFFIPALPNLLAKPGNSKHGANYLAHREQWDNLFDQALKLAQSSQPELAQEKIEQLHDIDDQFAESHYLQGQINCQLELVREAIEAFYKANMHDWRGDRVNIDLFNSIISCAQETGVPFLDLRDSIDRYLLSEYKTIEKDGQISFFSDHCHISQEVHETVANAAVQLISHQMSSEISSSLGAINISSEKQ